MASSESINGRQYVDDRIARVKSIFVSVQLNGEEVAYVTFATALVGSVTLAGRQKDRV